MGIVIAVRYGLVAALWVFFVVSAAKAQQADGPDAILWKSLQNSTDILAFETFLDAFPDSEYAALAGERLAALANPGQADGPDACDLLTAHPSDKDRRLAEGVPFATLQADPQPAITACLALVDSDPTGRVAFQLSRAYAAIEDAENRFRWVKTAAGQGWGRARYRLGRLLIDDEGASDARLHDAVDMLQEVGEDYPFGYVEAAHTLWERLEGPEVHRDRIIEMFDRAAELGEDDAYMQLARFVRDGHVEATAFEMMNLLTQMMQDDHKTGWAKDTLAQRISSIFEVYREDNHYGDYNIAAARGTGFGADRTVSEAEMQTMIDWALEAIEFSENTGRFSFEDRYTTLRRMIYDYALAFPPPSLRAGMTPEAADSISAFDDPRLKQIMDLFCRFTEAASDASYVDVAKEACLTFLREFDEKVYEGTTYFHLIGLNRSAQIASVRDFLSTPADADVDFTQCLTTGDVRIEGDAIAVPVTNRCPAPILAIVEFDGFMLVMPDGAFPTAQTLIPARSTKTMTAVPDLREAEGVSLNSFTRAEPWGCHDGYTAPFFDWMDPVCDMNLRNEAGSNTLLTSLSMTLIWDEKLRTIKGAIDGNGPPSDAPRFGIAEDQCALIVAARQTEAEARAYIAAYPNTNDWFWKVFESQNGWFAISASLVLSDEADYALRTLKGQGAIPDDAYCSGPGAFIRRAF